MISYRKLLNAKIWFITQILHTHLCDNKIEILYIHKSENKITETRKQSYSIQLRNPNER